MTETTTATTSTPVALTPELMRQMLQDPTYLKIFAEVARDARQDAAKARREAFEAVTPDVQQLLADVASLQELETWYARDKDTKKLTDKVRAQGYTLDGSVPMDMGNGTTQEWKVRMTFTRVDGSAPADVSGGPEDDDDAHEGDVDAQIEDEAKERLLGTDEA